VVQSAALRALGSPRRREILRLVWDDELSAGQIAAHFDVSWPAISQNLRVLRNAGLLLERRTGNWRLYRTDQAALGPMAAVIRDLWQSDLQLLRSLAEDEEQQAT
jgi:DNA-binding transcriptional ArsR family regulator